MSKAAYFILGVVVIGGAAYAFRDKLFASAAPGSLPSTPESAAADYGLRGAYAGAVDAALGGLDAPEAPTTATLVLTAPAPRLTLATLVGAAPRSAAA